LLALGALQDHDVTNQYTAFGSFRPDSFSRWTTTVVWWLVNLATPILYPRGNLARIKTIHFARWVFLDGKRRGLFASNYDGSSESYMDDFVNKVSFGLNLTFSRGVGYPRTRFCFGAEPTRAGVGTSNAATHCRARVRQGLPRANTRRHRSKCPDPQGLERKTMTEIEIRQWLSEI
jgi:hypothetical protein